VHVNFELIYLFTVFLDQGKLFDSFETPEYYPLEKLKVSCCYVFLCIFISHRCKFSVLVVIGFRSLYCDTLEGCRGFFGYNSPKRERI